MIVGLIVNTLAFILIAELLPGFRVRSHGSALGVALLYAITHVLVWWLTAAVVISVLVALFAAIPPLGFLAGFASILALPLLAFFVSVFALVLADKMMDGFHMDSMATAVVAALLLAAINLVTGAVLGI